MSYLGNKPTTIPLSGSDLIDGIIDSNKIAVGAVVLESTDVTGTLPLLKGGTGGTSIKTINSNSIIGSGNIAVGDVTLVGTQTLTNKTITDTVFTVTGTSPALTATNGAVQTWTLSGASTPTSSLTSGQSIILVITPGANTITWPSVVWTKQGGGGVAPTLNSAGKTSVVLWVVSSVVYGSHLGDTV